jgi:heme-degrading monooxygenase HmoA
MIGKRMTRLPAGPGAEQWTGPVLVRGWLRVRQPWRHPIAVLRLFGKWSRLKKDVDRGDGFLSFEYWQRLNLLVFGMHVGWSSQADLLAFYRTPSHRDIAAFATASPLVRAMKLETIAIDADDHIIRLGGFVICTDESDLPNDSLFPGARGESQTSPRDSTNR